MKFLFLIFLAISQPIFACINTIPISEAELAINLSPNAGGATCLEKASDECLCFDSVTLWQAVEIKDEYINGAPIYSPKENVKECAELECKELGPDYCKDFDGYQFYYAATSIGLGYEAYCIKVTGYEQIKSGKHLLVENPVKKAAYIQAQKDTDGLSRQEIIDLKADIETLLVSAEVVASTNNATLKDAVLKSNKRIAKLFKFFMREMKGN
jgi:hypothetical protein